MVNFNPIEKIINSTEILESDGCWPSFEETHVISLTYKRANYIPDPGYFEDPTIDASIEFSYNDSPCVVDLQFRRCSSVVMSYFNNDNTIYHLLFSIEQRGFYADGITPLPPFICVEIGTSEYSFCEETGCHSERTVFTSFKCFEIEVLGKREISGASYA